MLKSIIDIVSNNLSINASRLNQNSKLCDLDMDRRDFISVVTDLEDEYDIIIDYSKLNSFETLGDLETYVESKI